MGLLDDAIREHLDLKRRRGADPAEVERAEREALGPVRRNPNPAELAETEAAAGPADAPAYDQAGDEDWSHDSLQDPMDDAGLPPVYDEGSAEPPVHAQPEFPAPEAAPLHDVRDPLAEEPFEDEPFDEEEPAHRALPRAARGPPGRGAPAPRPPSTTSRTRSPPKSRTIRAVPTRTCWRRRPSSSRTRRTTIACGSSSGRPRTSTSTSRAAGALPSSALPRSRLRLLSPGRRGRGDRHRPALGHRALPGDRRRPSICGSPT